MFYRDAGSLKTTYAQEQAIFPVALDRWAVLGLVAAGALVVPAVAGPYWLGSILLPFLILSLAAIGLNILTGYAGQVSLGECIPARAGHRVARPAGGSPAGRGFTGEHQSISTGSGPWAWGW